MYELNLLLPDISSERFSVEERFAVLKAYLCELNDTLSIALSSIENEGDLNYGTIKKETEKAESALLGEIKKGSVVSKKLKEEIVSKFNALKTEIIATADEIEHEYTSAIETAKNEIIQNVGEKYTAKSVFGEYKSETDTKIKQNASAVELASEAAEEAKYELLSYKLKNSADIEVLPESIISQVERLYAKKSDESELEERLSSKITQTATDITESFSLDVEKLEEDISSVGGTVSSYISGLDAYIRRGEIATGVYGIEVGRTDSAVKARFTNDRLSFLQGESEVAYISGSNLYITRAQVLDSLEIGNSEDGFFTFDVTGNGLEVRWSYGN